ncbi:MAG: Phosphoserine phosphatase [Alphaproteobacteria bacterium MarineAlpha11_Bin1]|nr:MAG: Phosphoserine phosphatase [Alphaproteobacteria bacterium MarineAlpha11_Bin1]|tara:strand:- start:8223 stop:8900 length:678 start_codon:yes stop_codon:yes gene_type:complete
MVSWAGKLNGRVDPLKIVCLDMEGVITPEIWIELAERTGIDELRRTTRDEPNYGVLMDYRLDILDRYRIGLEALKPIINGIEPLPGALDFLDSIRREYQLVILSDTFYEFVGPLMAKMGHPTLFCHRLMVDTDGKLSGYQLRLPDHKRLAVKAFKGLNFFTCAAGDSYNDTRMLEEADAGFLFCPPQNVIDEFPQFSVFTEYDRLLSQIDASVTLDFKPDQPISA